MKPAEKCMIFTLILAMSARPAAAYLDPGTGSYILQLLLGGLFAGLFTLRIYWDRIKARLKSMFLRKEDDRKTG